MLRSWRPRAGRRVLGRLRLSAVQEALPAERMGELLAGRALLPNEWHPSDHLPVAAAFSFR